MKKNILLDNAVFKNYKNNKKVKKNNFYDSNLGFWVSKNGLPSILDISFRIPQTKKCDVERGEDKKDE